MIKLEEPKQKTISDAVREANSKPPAVSSAMEFVPWLSLDKLCDVAQEKLSQALQAIDPTPQNAEAIRKIYAELKDRRDGRPSQSIVQSVNVNVHREEAADQLRKLPPEKIREALAILQMQVVE